MAILQLSSENPNFSYLIRKNPNSGMFLKNLHKGTIFAWYSNNNKSFNIYFKDADNDISYKISEFEEFEYLNTSKFNAPSFYLNAISDVLSEPIKGLDDDKDGFNNSFLINLVFVGHRRYLEFFSKYFEKEFNLKFEEITYKNYKIVIETTKNLQSLLNFVNVLMIFLNMFGEQYLVVNESILNKYINAIISIESPYFIRYLFSRNFLKSKKLFHQYKPILEKNTNLEINLEFGDTALQRRNAIEQFLSFENNIIDIGCGEGFYALLFSKKIEKKQYFAIDKNQDIIENLNKKIKSKNIHNISTFNSLEEFLKNINLEDKFDILLVEVIEHMPFEEAKKLIRFIKQNLLKHENFNSLIITTPNSNFNEFYMLEGFRHDDHDFELSKVEFEKFIEEELEEFNIQFSHIGDKINGENTSSCAIIKSQS